MRTLLDKSIIMARKLHEPYLQNFNVYCFIYDKRRLISVGRNNMLAKSKKVFDLGRRFGVDQFINYPYRHAEISAISRLWGRTYITGRETLITVRLTKDFNTANAKPCKDCMAVITALGIKKLEWTE